MNVFIFLLNDQKRKKMVILAEKSEEKNKDKAWIKANKRPKDEIDGQPVLSSTDGNKLATLALLVSGFALFMDTIPGFGYVLLGASFILSIVALFKKPRANAWLSLIISIIAVLPLLLSLWIRSKL